MNKERAIDILRRALDDEVRIDEVSEFLSSLNKRTENDLCRIIHSALHFVTDSDIRQVDREYDLSQRASLQVSLKSLQNDKKDDRDL